MSNRVIRYKAVQAKESLRYIVFFLSLCLFGLAAYSAAMAFLPPISTQGNLASSLLVCKNNVDEAWHLMSQGSITEDRYLCLTAFDRFFLSSGTARYMYIQEGWLVEGKSYSTVCLLTLTAAFPFLGPALGVFFGYLLFGKDLVDGAIKNVFQGGMSRGEAFSGSFVCCLLIPFSFLGCVFAFLFLSSIPVLGMSFLIQDGESVVQCPGYLAGMMSLGISAIGCLLAATLVGICSVIWRGALLSCALPACFFLLPLALSVGISKAPGLEFYPSLARSALPFSGLMLGCSGGCYAPTYINASVSLLAAAGMAAALRKLFGRASF